MPRVAALSLGVKDKVVDDDEERRKKDEDRFIEELQALFALTSNDDAHA